MIRPDNRWPRWVYAEGEEPDYRFTFANERTFLAWIRTSLALLAASVVLDVVDLDVSDHVRRLLAGLVAALGLLSSVVAWTRWATAERAIRRRLGLPSFGFAALLTTGLIAVTLILLMAGS